MSETTARPAAAGSALARLRDRRRKAEQLLFLDLKVPRLDPAVFVRYRPVDVAWVTDVNERHAESKAKDVEVIVDAVILSRACLGVFEVVDGKERSITDGATDPSEWPRFDERLAAELELPEDASPVEVIRGLFLTDWDVVAHSRRLRAWSGAVQEDLERGASGN